LNDGSQQEVKILKYYEDEVRRHAGPGAVDLEFKEAIDLTARLCELNGLPPIRVVGYRGRGPSTFRERKRGCYIKYNENHLTALVVLHETAHYLNWREWQKGGKSGRRPGHSRVHRVAVNRMVDQVLDNKLLAPKHMKRWRQAEAWRQKRGGKSVAAGMVEDAISDFARWSRS
jgi:hypothetical protein